MKNSKVSVVCITYNQEKYISQAIESVLMQKTDFDFELLIGEDCSTDGTREICLAYQKKHPETVKVVQRETNLGLVRNYLDVYQSCQGEYIASLEGDDYWTDPSKLQKQVDFLDNNPDFVICCHNIEVVDKDGVSSGPLLSTQPEESTVNDLCKGDYIATAASVVRNKLLDEIPEWIYRLPGYDWPLDILHAEKGKIRFLPEIMAAYRIHPEGVWTNMDEIEKLKSSVHIVETLNKEFNYKYNSSFKHYLAAIFYELYVRENEVAADYAEKLKSVVEYNPDIKGLLEWHSQSSITGRIEGLLTDRIEDVLTRKLDEILKGKIIVDARKKTVPGKVYAELKRFERRIRRYRKSATAVIKEKLKPRPELIILDDVFPNPLSAFRLQEYNSYLEYFKDVGVYSLGVRFGGYDDFDATVKAYEERFPKYKGRTAMFCQDNELKAKLIYTIFLGNAWWYLDTIEKHKIPFVFTLYPGGAFCVNEEVSDGKLSKIFASPCFRKVIVTQKLTYDYLLRKGFCAPEQIEHVFGVVTPLELLNKKYEGKRRFGRDKKTLDICFVAHKYTEKGVDKGYDVFVDVARSLAGKHKNINFHVVGGFDETVIHVKDIGDRVKFYGHKTTDWFDKFYMDMDLILSPNIPFQAMDGMFDGFPTGCCTDACLHKVAIFCTDVLGLNTEFKDGEEIVIVPHDAEEITKIIERYYAEPERLRAIAENGRKKALELYSYESQIKTRIKILEKEIKGA